MMSSPHIALYQFQHSSFTKNVETLLSVLHRVEGYVVRVVVFAAVSDNDDYTNKLEHLQSTMLSSFGGRMPLFSLIAQPPLESAFAAEVHTIDSPVVYHTNYVTTADGQSLFATITPLSVNAPISEQSEAAFHQLAEILATEHFSISSIVRQWNYVERITEVDAHGQRYQQFNDARSAFYEQEVWPNGYPAATGIGTSYGGVTIDIDATLSTDVEPIDNPLQVAAHHYSGQVLVEGNQSTQTSPKFERAKRVGSALYVSGTAAIRGEQTMVSDVAKQTEVTIENIHVLMNQTPTERLSHIRVYVKHSHHLPSIRSLVNSLLPTSTALYVQSDICRPDLLIEIEGVG